MTIYKRLADGADVDAERYDGQADTALEIAEMLCSPCRRIPGGALMIPSGGREIPMQKGSWVVKSKSGWVILADSDFRSRYR